MYLSSKSVYNKEHKEVICDMTDKVPYITVKKIFTQSFHNCIPYILTKGFPSQKMLVSPSDFRVKGQVILTKALILQDECFGKNFLSFLDFTRNYKRKSGIFVP